MLCVNVYVYVCMYLFMLPKHVSRRSYVVFLNECVCVCVCVCVCMYVHKNCLHDSLITSVQLLSASSVMRALLSGLRMYSCMYSGMHVCMHMPRNFSHKCTHIETVHHLDLGEVVGDQQRDESIVVGIDGHI
jgi:hypothetical protein